MKKNQFISFIGLTLLLVILVIPIRTASAEAAIGTCHGTLALQSVILGDVTEPGGNYHERGRVIVYKTDFPEDCVLPLDGYNTITANLNWDSADLMTASGPSWGTFYKTVNAYEDTGIAGTFTAMKSPSGYIGKIRGFGYGEFEGYRVMGEMSFTNPLIGTIIVQIFEH